MAKRTKAAVPLRKIEARRNNRPVIDLGALNSHLGYFVRRAQIWIFQDFIRKLAEIGRAHV